MSDDDLTFATLDDLDEQGTDAARVRGWGEALARGFHQGRTNDAFRQFWLDAARADEVVHRGVWPERTAVADADMPVATYASWEGRLNVGGEHQVPLHMVSDVTVAPTHRRRGLLRRLMTEDLADAAAHGRPLAALLASEGTIYGRFGFGPATRLRQIEVDVSARFMPRDPFGCRDDGWLEMPEPAEAWPTVSAVFDHFHSRTRGSVTRPASYQPLLTGAFSHERGGPNPQLRAVVHLDGQGEPDGYALYEHQGRTEPATVHVHDLVTTTTSAQLQLWWFLAGLDLVDRVTWHQAPLDHVLEWWVNDPRVVRTTRVTDRLWVRALDVGAALGPRPWYADGVIVLEVVDPLGHAAGRWRVVVAAGHAQVTATDDPAEVEMDAATLGSLYLGDVDTPTLRAAGRLTGDPVALDRWAAMADGGPAPYCVTGF